jgi:plastocyanin
MFSINGTERHIYELYNFLPKLNNFNHISSSQGNIISGTIDVKLNGEEIWKGINCTLTISKDSIIMILLNSRSTENEFNNQPIYGIMESFKKIRGNQTTVKSLAGEKSTGSLIENRLNSRNDTTQIISGIIDSANKQASHYATTRNKTGEKDLGQFNNANNLSIDILRDSPIAERHTNIIIVKGADNPSNEEFFYPQNIFVSPGSTITWVNKDSAIHTATATNEEGLIIGYSLFDTGFIQTGESSKPIKMPQQGGVFSYYCKIHPFMTGTLTVASPSNGMAYAK